MRRVALAIAAVVGVPGFVLAGAPLAGASPPDVARVTSVRTSARRLHVGDPFSVTASAIDRASNDYMVIFVDDPWTQLHLGDLNMTCRGVSPGSPSPDTPGCEYDDFTTTTRTTTYTSGSFRVTASTPKSFGIKVCAASFTNAPDPWPGGGSCQTITFMIR
jgi:hypothetical protein